MPERCPECDDLKVIYDEKDHRHCPECGNVQWWFEENYREDALDKMYDYIDDLLIRNEFDRVDTCFENTNVEKTPIVLSIGLLTITYVWRNYLEQRENFYQRLLTYCVKKEGKHTGERLLRGLR